MQSVYNICYGHQSCTKSFKRLSITMRSMFPFIEIHLNTCFDHICDVNLYELASQWAIAWSVNRSIEPENVHCAPVHCAQANLYTRTWTSIIIVSMQLHALFTSKHLKCILNDITITFHHLKRIPLFLSILEWTVLSYFCQGNFVLELTKWMYKIPLASYSRCHLAYTIFSFYSDKNYLKRFTLLYSRLHFLSLFLSFFDPWMEVYIMKTRVRPCIFQHSIVLLLFIFVVFFPFFWNGHGHYYAVNIVKQQQQQTHFTFISIQFNSVHFFSRVRAHIFFSSLHIPSSLLFHLSMANTVTVVPFVHRTYHFSPIFRRRVVCSSVFIFFFFKQIKILLWSFFLKNANRMDEA